jgi:hypothetical protein
MSIDNEAEYRRWLTNQGRWSAKGCNDLVSRVKRADRLVPITPSMTESGYMSDLERAEGWSSIPASSRQSIRAAVALFLDWRRST